MKISFQIWIFVFSTHIKIEQPAVVSEPVFQHQQNIEPIKPKVAEKVQFKLDEPVAKEPQISTLPNLADPPVLQNSGNKQAAEEIKQLRARLADALKQIEILSRFPNQLFFNSIHHLGLFWKKFFYFVSVLHQNLSQKSSNQWLFFSPLLLLLVSW